MNSNEIFASGSYKCINVDQTCILKSVTLMSLHSPFTKVCKERFYSNIITKDIYEHVLRDN